MTLSHTNFAPDETRPRLTALCPLALALSLAACTTRGPAPTTATPVAPAAVLPAPSPTQEPLLTVENFEILPVGTLGSTVAVGVFRNTSGLFLQDLALQARITTVEGDEARILQAQAARSHLAPGEDSAFRVPLDAPIEIDTIRLDAISYLASSFERPLLEMYDLQAVRTSNGSPAVLGTIENRSQSHARLFNLAALASDGEGEPLGYAPALLFGASIPTGGSVPFLIETLDPQAELAFFADALTVSVPPALPFQGLDALRLAETGQGRIFALGELVNSGDQPRWIHALVLVKKEDDVFAMAELRSPAPIPAGVIQPIAVPAKSFLLAAPGGPLDESLHIEVLPDPFASQESGPLADLSVELHQYERVGGTLIMRGEVANASDFTVQSPAAFISLRGSAGTLLAAGWSSAGERLAAGDRLPFEITLDLARGIDLTQAEFDLRAWGIQPPA